MLQVQQLIIAIMQEREVSGQLTVPGAELGYLTWITQNIVVVSFLNPHWDLECLHFNFLDGF